jgi:dUTP pyrophosphatase
MSKKLFIPIERLNPDVILPKYANLYDAGMDVYSTEDIEIKPQETKIVPTGLKLAIPPGYEIQVRPRSGISLKTPLRISNSPGTIDTGWRGELGILVTNTSEDNSGDMYSFFCNETYDLDEALNRKGTYIIRKGDKVAQIVAKEVLEIIWNVVDSVANIGTDRNGGFGSSGTK